MDPAQQLQQAQRESAQQQQARANTAGVSAAGGHSHNSTRSTACTFFHDMMFCNLTVYVGSWLMTCCCEILLMT